MTFQKILVALDYSPLCQTVFAQALELAQATRARIKLFHCLPSMTMGKPVAPGALDLALYPEMVNNLYPNQPVVVENRLEQAQALLQSYYEVATSRGVPTEFDYQVGNTGQLLCDVAQEWGADLIVVGRRGHTGLAEALLGSASNYVLHNAPCSVLAIQTERLQEAATSATDDEEGKGVAPDKPMNQG